MYELSVRRLLLLTAILFPAFIALGCSTNGDYNPALPSQGKSSEATSPHYILGYWIITLDKNNGAEVIPLREAAGHWNVIGFLEESPCDNCLEVVGLDWTLEYVEADIRIRHPFPGSDIFTGFDVRGICFLPGTFDLPGMMQSMPYIGKENYLEPIPGAYMGYTDLFNPVTSPEGLPFGYAQGKLTPWPKEMLTSTLGAFQYYATEPNVRNAFRTSDVITNTYRIMRAEAGQVVFGYAVDASWQMPDEPVEFPDSFGPYANCLEAWKIELEVDDSGLTENGGSLDVVAVVYDHQGIDTLFTAYIECPDINPDVIEGTVAWEDEPNKCRAYEFAVPNVNGTAMAGDKVPFVIRANPMEELVLYAFNASTATVHEVSSDCPSEVHSDYFGKGEFEQFGNWINLQTDAAILTQGDLTGEFIMFGNGFAGSMMGSYYIGDLGPNDPNGLVGLVGVGAPSSLDVSAVYGNIFLVMPYDNANTEIHIYRPDGTQLPDVVTPHGGPINSLDVTPNEEIWFIEQVDDVHYLHHAIAIAEWNWSIVDGDSLQIMSDLPTVPKIFDIVYEAITERLYIYHEYTNGAITVYDASGSGPPVEMTNLSKEAIWGYSGPLEFYDGGYYCTGADIEIDFVDDSLTDCRIVVFANFELGGSSVMKLDADVNYLDLSPLEAGPFLTFAISIDPDLTLRRLVFLPLTQQYEDDYFLFDPPADW